MTLAEFHAWLEGYSASFEDGHPNAEQWTQIVNRLANVQPLKFEYAPFEPNRGAMTTPVPWWKNPVVATSATTGGNLDPDYQAIC